MSKPTRTRYGTQTDSYQELRDINKEAQAAGMTYGQYVAMQYVKGNKIIRKGNGNGKHK